MGTPCSFCRVKRKAEPGASGEQDSAEPSVCYIDAPPPETSNRFIDIVTPPPFTDPNHSVYESAGDHTAYESAGEHTAYESAIDHTLYESAADDTDYDSADEVRHCLVVLSV